MSHSRTVPSEQIASGADRSWIAVIALLGGALAWAYWPVLVALNKEWQTDDNYSVGQLVPLAILYLLWHDRERLRSSAYRPCWWGIGIILVAQGARAFGLIWLFESAERYSFVLSVVGVVLLVGGWEVFWRVKWLLLFLFLMVPLPGRVHNLISGPLQQHATDGAVFFLELLGITLTSEGHVIVLNDNVPLAVAEACSGLRMLTAFVVVAATLAYLVNRPRWQKIALVLSSIPVAILCNTGRLVITALLFLVTSSEFANRFFHDFAGFTMMPMAVLMLILELWIMSKLVIDEALSESASTP